MIDSLWRKYPKLQKKLQLTQNFIIDNIKLENDEISGDLINLVKSGGKMIRPAMLILFSEFGMNKKDDDVIKLAASVEILHLATLVHDDVLDDAATRRSQPTINNKHGIRNAIYTGDYLFALYFEIIARVSPSRTTLVENSGSMKKILGGELNQLKLIYNTDATVKMYLKEIAGKTAELFKLSSQSGAEITEADKKVIVSAKYIGHYIGMAFQIVDDTLDYEDTKKTGKTELGDIKNGVYSLPIIFGLQLDETGRLKEILNKKDKIIEDDTREIVEIIRNSGALDETKRLANIYTEKAITRVKGLPDNKAKKILLEIAQKSQTRTI